jgi:hypothetical protein
MRAADYCLRKKPLNDKLYNIIYVNYEYLNLLDVEQCKNH